MKPLILPLLLILFAYYRSEGFDTWKLAPTENANLSKAAALDSFFSQPYRYLGRGRQAFAFESLDGKYVIKFFDSTYSTIPFWSAFLPKERREHEIAKRQQRAEVYRSGYRLAFTELRESSGLIALHFETTQNLPPLRIQTRAHQEEWLDLNGIAFVLQRKASPFPTRLSDAEASYRALLDLRIAHQIGDYEHHIDGNFGWLGEQLIFLDSGRLHRDLTLARPTRAAEERERSLKRFAKWRAKQ